jgi:hypothetical protein
VSEHIVSPRRSELQTAPIPLEKDFKSLRKAKPTDVLLPRTACWIAALPLEVRPVETAKAFPRIANALALLWSVPDELTVYLDELLVDRRGGRQGFPLRVLSEFDILREYCACPLHETDS